MPYPIRTLALFLLVFPFAGACGGKAHPQSESPATLAAAKTEASKPEPPSSIRDLKGSDSFSDLLKVASKLDRTQAGNSESGCLFRGGEGSLRFEADVAAAVHPLIEAPQDLSPSLENSLSAVQILTRWGQVGAGGPGLTLVTFTSVPQPIDGSYVAIFLTAKGVYLRSTEKEVDKAHAGPFPTADLLKHLKKVRKNTYSNLAVTAEEGIRLNELRELFGTLKRGENGAVALAVSLPENTRLPAPDPARAAGTDESNEAMCTEGLSLPDPKTPQGKVEAEAMAQALEPLKEAAKDCVAKSGDKAGTGGNLNVQLRLSAQGSVKEACFNRDTIGSARLRQCLVEVLRKLSYPRPEPSGEVDLALPLVVPADPSLHQQPLCDAS